MDEFRWSEVQEQAKESLDELLANIRSEIARESHDYLDGNSDRIGFEITQQDRADEWVRLVWQMYCDALAGLGREYSDVPPTTWSAEILGFIDHEIEPLLEAAFGVTDKDREFLRRGGITVQRLNRTDDHPLDKSTPWLKVQAAQWITERLKETWKTRLSATGKEQGSTAPLTGSPTQNLGVAPILDNPFLANSSPISRVWGILDDLQRARDERHRREMDLHYKDLNRARELAHARELAKIQQADADSKAPNAENDLPQAGSGTRHRGKADYRSPWKRAIRQALLVLREGVSYQEIANWIAENVPELDLPGYCARAVKSGGRSDIGLLYRTNKAVRDQFSKDVAKIKADLRV